MIFCFCLQYTILNTNSGKKKKEYKRQGDVVKTCMLNQTGSDNRCDSTTNVDFKCDLTTLCLSLYLRQTKQDDQVIISFCWKTVDKCCVMWFNIIPPLFSRGVPYASDSHSVISLTWGNEKDRFKKKKERESLRVKSPELCLKGWLFSSVCILCDFNTWVIL